MERDLNEYENCDMNPNRTGASAAHILRLVQEFKLLQKLATRILHFSRWRYYSIAMTK